MSLDDLCQRTTIHTSSIFTQKQSVAFRVGIFGPQRKVLAERMVGCGSEWKPSFFVAFAFYNTQMVSMHIDIDNVEIDDFTCAEAAIVKYRDERIHSCPRNVRWLHKLRSRPTSSSPKTCLESFSSLGRFSLPIPSRDT